MTQHEYADKDLRCAACGDGFVFSAGEQELNRLRGITEPPQLCPRCTRRRLLVASRAVDTTTFTTRAH